MMKADAMNKRSILLAGGMAVAVVLTISAMIASTAEAQTPLVTGDSAPDFTGVTSNGETVSLSDFAGRTVMLEWTNHDCPFVMKHYDAELENMQGLQEDAAMDDVVWLSIISSAPGKQGHVDADTANQLTASRNASPAHVILDESGDIGRLFAAKTTPHMYVIDSDGVLAYQGAIDSNPSARVGDIEDALPWASDAMIAVVAGNTPDPATTQPYGCSVKY